MKDKTIDDNCFEPPNRGVSEESMLANGKTVYARAGQVVGEATDEKNFHYGSAFEKISDYLKILYPDGIRPEQYKDALLLARDFDKNMRIANSKDAYGESPYRDKAGYALLGFVADVKEKLNKIITYGELVPISDEEEEVMRIIFYTMYNGVDFDDMVKMVKANK